MKLPKFLRFPKRKRVNEMVNSLAGAIQVTDTHLIALARLTFVRPADLVREGKNVKANAEYLLEMVKEAKKKEVKSGRPN